MLNLRAGLRTVAILGAVFAGGVGAVQAASADTLPLPGGTIFTGPVDSNIPGGGATPPAILTPAEAGTPGHPTRPSSGSISLSPPGALSPGESPSRRARRAPNPGAHAADAGVCVAVGYDPWSSIRGEISYAGSVFCDGDLEGMEYLDLIVSLYWWNGSEWIAQQGSQESHTE